MSKDVKKEKVVAEVVGTTEITEIVNEKMILVTSSNIKDAIEEVDEQFVNVTESFFDLGKVLFNLKEIWNNDTCGCSFYEFCEKRYKLKAHSIFNFIQVYLTYKNDDWNKQNETFRNVSFSNLVELLPLKENKDIAQKLIGLNVKDTRYMVKNITDGLKYNNVCNFLKSVCSLVNKKISEYFGVKVELNLSDLKNKDLEIYDRIDNDINGISDIDLLINKYHLYLVKNETTLSKRISLDVPDFVSSEICNFIEKYFVKLTYEIYLTSDDDFCLKMESSMKSCYLYVYEHFNLNGINELLNNISIEIFENLTKLIKDEFLAKKEKIRYVPTGALKRLGLEKKDIEEYVNNFDNYDIEKGVKITLGLIDVSIYPLKGCDYIYALKNHHVEDDSFSIVDSSLDVLYSKWEYEELMCKE